MKVFQKKGTEDCIIRCTKQDVIVLQEVLFSDAEMLTQSATYADKQGRPDDAHRQRKFSALFRVMYNELMDQEEIP